MIQLAANLSMLFPEHDFLDRFAAARAAGFKAVEYLFPYQWPAELLAEKLEEAGLEQVLFNMPPGDWDNGERGISCLPGREQEFQDGVGQALEYAKVLRAPRLHCMAGVVAEDSDRQVHLETYLQNLDFAARACAEAGLDVLIEPINPYDIPGYFLNHSQQALDVLQQVSHANARLQYDLYHMHRMGDDMPAFIAANVDQIAHIQVAGHPGRHEPDCGEVPFMQAFNTIDAQGYRGWIGCEYNPKTTTIEGLDWAKPYLT